MKDLPQWDIQWDAAGHEPPPSPERRLWRAVLSQAILDAVAEVTVKDPKARAEQLRDRDEARTWLLKSSAHLEWVCDAAGLDVVLVHKQARTLEYRGWQISKAWRKRVEAGSAHQAGAMT
jgi:hypothetical protein